MRLSSPVHLFAILVAVVFAAATAANKASDTKVSKSTRGAWTPTLALIQEIERIVQMPNGARPLAAYTRYYAGRTVKGRQLVLGTYVARSTSSASLKPINIVDSEKELPMIFDSGCGVLNLAFDIPTKRVMAVTCNGVG